MIAENFFAPPWNLNAESTMMTRDKLLAHVRRSPFRPYSMHLVDGRDVLAANSDCMFVSRMGTIFHESDDGALSIFEIDQIESVQVMPSPRRKAA